jgi:hypothetical protein
MFPHLATATTSTDTIVYEAQSHATVPHQTTFLTRCEGNTDMESTECLVAESGATAQIQYDGFFDNPQILHQSNVESPYEELSISIGGFSMTQNDSPKSDPAVPSYDWEFAEE